MAHPADTTLSYFFKDERIGSKERELVAETVFGVLRHRLLLEHACSDNPTPRRMALAWLVRFGGYNLREIEPVLKRDEKEWLGTVKGVKAESLPLPVQAELPEWLVEKMRASYSDEDILAIGLSMQQGAPLDIRVNTLLAKRDEVLQQLHDKKIEAAVTPYSPIGIRLKEKIPLNRDALFTEGKMEVQDEGSQLLGFLLAPKRNDMVVDFCAGAGGKTLMLSALMNSQGRLYAMDVSEKRLANLKPRLKRSGASNIQPMLISHENDLKVKRLAGKIDRVLVDAPCSGLGTLRRNPDLKFRQSPGSIEELNAETGRHPRLSQPPAEKGRTPGIRDLQLSCRKRISPSCRHFSAHTPTSCCFLPVTCCGNTRFRWIPVTIWSYARIFMARMVFLRLCWSGSRCYSQ